MNGKRIAIALAALGCASGAQAAVIYTFDSGVGNFTYSSPDFITSLTDLAPNELDSCSSQPTTQCNGVSFRPRDDLPDLIVFGFSGPAFSSQSFYDFQDGTFFQLGFYTSSFGLSTLNVSGSPHPLPEPATWLTMLLGFGFVGLAARAMRGRSALAWGARH